jgi:hypothetical protein
VGKVAATLVYVSQTGPFWDLDENGLNITRHKSATATFEKRIDVFFMRFFLNERLFAVDFKISKINVSNLLKVPPTNRALYYLR